MIGNPTRADTVVIDFYSVLDAALKARGLHYKAYINTNADVELPMIDTDFPTYLSDVRMVDHDVVLVKRGLRSREVESENFRNNLGLDLGGVFVEFTRGYVVVDVKIKRETFRFVNTHLEVRSAPGSYFRVVQSAQMAELLGTIEALTDTRDPLPVIMVGDFNSSPEDIEGAFDHPIYGQMPYVPPYMQAIEDGYWDAWTLQRKYDEGYTSGFDEYVSDPTAELASRIDLVFLDPMLHRIGSVKCEVVGNEISDMTPSGLWPSDHAGVVAKIRFINPGQWCPRCPWKIRKTGSCP
jgi:endonuclease/exonuclease/phosphatase family metal-dependent hydrolase